MMPMKIEEISIEHHSYCNRRCPWCSNSVIPRDYYKEMPEETFLSVIQSVEKHRSLFADRLAISACRYNEPFYNPQLAIHRLNLIKEMLPNSLVQTNTNGDFLTKEVLDALHIDKVNILDYDFKGVDACLKIMKTLGVKVRSVNMKNSRILGYSKTIPSVTYRADFLKTARLQDRGGVVDSEVAWMDKTVQIDRVKRDYPCTMPLRTVSIDYNGDVFLCYNLRHDNPAHKELCVGNVNDTDLIETLNGEKAEKIKRFATMTEGFPEPCQMCTNKRNDRPQLLAKK